MYPHLLITQAYEVSAEYMKICNVYPIRCSKVQNDTYYEFSISTAIGKYLLFHIAVVFEKILFY